MDLIASAGAFLAGNMLYVAPGATQCAAVRIRSRASAAPVQTLPPLAREPTTITRDRAMPSPAAVAPPTIASAGLLTTRLLTTRLLTTRLLTTRLLTTRLLTMKDAARIRAPTMTR